MNMKILKGTVIGGVVFFFMGWLIWGILLADFMAANYNPAVNRPADEMIWWSLILSNLVTALFLTLVLDWSGAKGMVDGIKTGALFGFLYALSIDLSLYSMTVMSETFMPVIVDVVVYTVVMGIIGMIIVLTWGKEKAV